MASASLTALTPQRARIERLIGGQSRPEDVQNLLLFAREHHDGRLSVKEAGDLVAHHVRRDRGPITTSVREWAIIINFFLLQFLPGRSRGLQAGKLPSVSPSFFRIAAQRTPDQQLKKECGWRQKAAIKRLREIADDLQASPDGTWRLPPVSTQDMKLLNYVSRVLVVEPAFEASRLKQEFLAVLRSQGMITRKEEASHGDHIGNLCCLLMIGYLHRCNVILDDGTSAQLRVDLDPSENRIHVRNDAPLGSEEIVRVEFSIFELEVPFKHYINEELLNIDTRDHFLELGPDGKLSLL